MTDKKTNTSLLKNLLLRQSFFQATLLLIFFNFLGKFLGYVREMAIAGFLGAKAFTDAFFLAQIIPVLGASLLTSAMPLVFIPLYLKERENSEELAEKFASAAFWGILCFLLLICFILYLVSSPLTKLMAPGASIEELTLVRSFLLFLLPAMVFQGLIGFFSAYLQAKRNFFFPALAFSLINIPIVLLLFLFARQYPFQSLVWGVNLGYFLPCLLLFPTLFYFGFNPLLSFDIFGTRIRRLIIMLFPIVIGSGLAYIDMLIARAVAWSLGEGIVSSLSFSYRLMGIPLGLMAGSIGTAVFPFMSSQAALLDKEALAKETLKSLNATWFVSMPIAVIFIVLPQSVVRIMFERGAFTPEATQVTATMLCFFALGIPALTAWGLLNRTFYSLQDTITPLKLSFIQLTIDIILLFTLPKLMGYRGIPLATSIAITVGFLIQLKVLTNRLQELKAKDISWSFYKVLFMSLFQAMFLSLLYEILGMGKEMKLMRELILLASVGGSSFLVYVWVGYKIRYPGIENIQKVLKKFVRRGLKGEGVGEKI